MGAHNLLKVLIQSRLRNFDVSRHKHGLPKGLIHVIEEGHYECSCAVEVPKETKLNRSRSYGLHVTSQSRLNVSEREATMPLEALRGFERYARE